KDWDLRIPGFGQLAMLHPVQLLSQLGILGPILTRSSEPGVSEFLAPPADTVAKVLVDAIRNVELRVFRPAIIPLGQSDFFLAQRLAVSSARVLLVRRAVGNMAVHDDQRWTVM